ncbi:MAG: TolC family protein [Myxococcota bacterium]
MPLLLWFTRALAQQPANLDGLLALALARDPEAAAAVLDADAARDDARAARVPMNPTLTLGGESLGAMPEDPDPPMFMFGLDQMLLGWGEARARSARAEVDAARAEADRARTAADLRLRLAQAAARIAALRDEAALLDEQARAAEALWQAGLRRYRSGAGRPGMGGGMGGAPMGTEAGPTAAPPTVRSGSGGGGGMPGMGGGGGGGARVSAPEPMEGMDEAAPMPATGMATGSDLPELLRVEAEIARVQAERAAVGARLDGEVAVLARFVGAETAAVVAAGPEGFLEGAAPLPPELRLAAVEREAAEADLRVARARIAPDVELGAAVNVMPEGMVQGADVMVGIEVPIWGKYARERDAAEARLGAAARREEAVTRDLGAAADAARAAETAALARAQVLRDVAVPRAEAAWRAALVRFAAGQSTAEDALRAWEGLLAARRELVTAERDQHLRAAERARVEVP